MRSARFGARRKPAHLRVSPLNINTRISETLERTLADPPSKVTTLKEMSPEKQAEMMRLYSKEKP